MPGKSGEVDVAIVGGGVVGLSIALLAAQRGMSTVLLERRPRFGEEASTHNSGVLHAGIYYPPGSLKARLCYEGRAELVARCCAWKVPFRLDGKLIVAAEASETQALEQLSVNAVACGVTSLELIDSRQVKELEPHIKAVAALWSPESGVVDTGEYLAKLAAGAQAAGVLLLTEAEVVGLWPENDRILIDTRKRGQVSAGVVVNCAGVYADEVAKLAGNVSFEIFPCRGEYAVVKSSRADLAGRPVYPMPRLDGLSLGIHLIRNTDGDLWIGPTARYIDRKDDYESDRYNLDYFLDKGRRLLPDLKLTDLRWGPSGIRAKRTPVGSPVRDFHIAPDPAVRNIIHLVGIESPGLTASPAIARYVIKLLLDLGY